MVRPRVNSERPGAVLIMSTVFFSFVSYALVFAQGIPPITSSGLHTQVSGPISQVGTTQYNVTGGTRPGGGPNLFHSFGTFNVPDSHIANFLNETGQPTANILGRVNGGSPSTVFGTVQTTGFGNANLYLMNPAGVVFGPGASLNVGGSVTVTTADYIKLADGVQFQAVGTAAADGLLSSAPVAAFGFLGAAPQAIQVQGSQLAVPEGGNLALVGGTIKVTRGTMTVPSGQVTLVGVGRPAKPTVGAEVVLAGTGLGYSPTGFRRLGTVQLTQGTSLQAGDPIDVNPAVGGSVLIRGGHFVMDGSSMTVGNGPRAGGPSGAIEVTAERVAISNSTLAIPGNYFFREAPGTIMLASRGDLDMRKSQVMSGGSQTVGSSIDLKAGNTLRLTDTTIDAAATVGSSITIVGRDIQISKGGLGTGTDGGPAGPIRLTAQRSVTLTNTTLDAGSHLGDGGTIEIRAGHQVTSQQSKIFVISDGLKVGTIWMDAKNVLLKDTLLDASSFVAAYGTGGQSRVGEITLTGTNIRLDNSQLLSLSRYEEGGTIRLNGRNVILNNTQLDTSAVQFITFPDAPLPQGGEITVTARNLTLANSQLRSTAVDGHGGTIHLTSRAFHIDLSSILDVSSQSGTNGTILIERR